MRPWLTNPALTINQSTQTTDDVKDYFCHVMANLRHMLTSYRPTASYLISCVSSKGSFTALVFEYLEDKSVKPRPRKTRGRERERERERERVGEGK